MIMRKKRYTYPITITTPKILFISCRIFDYIIFLGYCKDFLKIICLYFNFSYLYCHLERSRNPRSVEPAKRPRASRLRLGSRETVSACSLNGSYFMFGFSLALIHRRFRSLYSRFFYTNTCKKSSTACRNVAFLIECGTSSALRSE